MHIVRRGLNSRIVLTKRVMVQIVIVHDHRGVPGPDAGETVGDGVVYRLDSAAAHGLDSGVCYRIDRVVPDRCLLALVQ